MRHLVVAWLNGDVIDYISEVAIHWTQLVLGCVTVSAFSF